MKQLCNPVPTVLLLVGQALNHIPVLHGFIVFSPQAQLLGQTLPVRDAYVDGLRRCPTHGATEEAEISATVKPGLVVSAKPTTPTPSSVF